MVAGARAHRHLLNASRLLSSASIPLSCGRSDVPARVEQRETARKETSRLSDRIKDGLANAEGKAVEWKKDEENGIWKALMERREEATHDYEFLGTMATYAGEHLKKINAANPGESTPFVIALISNPDPQWVNKSTVATGPMLYILTHPPEKVKEVGERVKKVLEEIGGEKNRLKGGGSKGRFMAKVSGVWSEKDKEAVWEIL